MHFPSTLSRNESCLVRSADADASVTMATCNAVIRKIITSSLCVSFHCALFSKVEYLLTVALAAMSHFSTDKQSKRTLFVRVSVYFLLHLLGNFF